jgi:hypothetical protein
MSIAAKKHDCPTCTCIEPIKPIGAFGSSKSISDTSNEKVERLQKAAEEYLQQTKMAMCNHGNTISWIKSEAELEQALKEMMA